MMNEMQENVMEKASSIAKFLLSNPVDCSPNAHGTKIVIVGCGPVGVAIGVGILFKKLAAEVIFIDDNEELAQAEAEDMAHAAVYLGNPKIRGTRDYSAARDASLCVIASGRQQMNQYEDIEENMRGFKGVIQGVSKYAPNSILLIVSNPVDILSYFAMKVSGFPSQRVIGLGTFLDSCRLQHLVSKELGVSPNSVQSLVIGESGSTSVPIWSSVSVMGMKLKDINRDIGLRNDPERWGEFHAKVVNCNKHMLERKGNHCWAASICACEIIDAILRNTRACIVVSTFVKGCRHGFEKDIFMSLPCILGRNGVLCYMRHSYSQEEQDQMTRSSRAIYEALKILLEKPE